MAEVWRECHTCQRFLSKLHELQREAAMQVPGLLQPDMHCTHDLAGDTHLQALGIPCVTRIHDQEPRHVLIVHPGPGLRPTNKLQAACSLTPSSCWHTQAMTAWLSGQGSRG